MRGLCTKVQSSGDIPPQENFTVLHNDCSIRATDYSITVFVTLCSIAYRNLPGGNLAG